MLASSVSCCDGAQASGTRDDEEKQKKWREGEDECEKQEGEEGGLSSKREVRGREGDWNQEGGKSKARRERQ